MSRAARTHRFSIAAALALTLAAALIVPARAAAQAVPVDIPERGQNRITMDGLLGDWRRFSELIALDERSQVVSGASAWRDADDATVGFALARDDQNLYLAAEVRDDQVIRTREHRAHDDAIVLSLAVQPGGRFTAYDIVVFPGDPGNYGGAARFRGSRSGAVPGAQVVEAPLRSGPGFTIEVTIPWRAIPEIQANIGSLRARVSYQDIDSAGRGSPDSVLATGPGDGQHPDLLPPAAGSTGANARNAISEFQRSHDLNGAEPFLDRNGNFAGDASLERVVVFPRYVVAAGPGIAGGVRYSFVEFPYRNRDDVLDVSTRDVTGDGRLELLLRHRVVGPGTLAREVLTVYGATNGADTLSRIFAHEVAREQSGNRMSNRATWESGSRIRFTYDNNTGFTTQNWPRLVEPGVVPTLLPWGPNRAEIYRWSEQNQRFDLERAEANPNVASAGNAANGTVPSTTGSAPVTPVMTQAPADVSAVLRMFRQQRGIADDARPSFSAQASVSGDATPETVQIFSRYLVVTGARYMNGRSFYNMELPVTADGDVLGLQLADVTDDGNAEALVRVRRTLQAQVRGQILDAVKEYLLIYSFDDAHRGRVFAAEISRRVGADQVSNVVRPLRAGRNGEVVIEAGQARGWTGQTYPFHDQPQAGYAPLLLPWDATQRRAVYRWNGNALAPAQ